MDQASIKNTGCTTNTGFMIHLCYIHGAHQAQIVQARRFQLDYGEAGASPAAGVISGTFEQDPMSSSGSGSS